MEPQSRVPTRDIKPDRIERIAFSFSLSSSSLNVEPGADAGFDVAIRNRGTVVDRYRVEVFGPPSGWVHIGAPTVSVMPDTTGLIHVSVRPPRSAETQPGRTNFEIRVTSQEDPQLHDAKSGSMEVGVFTQIELGDLVPVVSQGWRRGRHTLTIVNRGNAPAESTIEATDPNNSLRFETPGAIVTGAGTTSSMRLLLKTAGWLFIGGQRIHPFKASVQSNGVQVGIRDGQMRQRALIPTAVLVALVTIVSLAALAVPLWVSCCAGKSAAATSSESRAGATQPTVTTSAQTITTGPPPQKSFLEMAAGQYQLLSWRENRGPVTLAMQAENGTLTLDPNGVASWSFEVHDLLGPRNTPTPTVPPGMRCRGSVSPSSKVLNWVPGVGNEQINPTGNMLSLNSDLWVTFCGYDFLKGADPFTLTLTQESSGRKVLEMTNRRGVYTWASS